MPSPAARTELVSEQRGLPCKSSSWTFACPFRASAWKRPSQRSSARTTRVK